MARVSILLPAYQAAGTVEAALRSVERQRFADWRCVVVDDGSTDDTAAIASAFASRDPRFELLSRTHTGLVESLNAGLAFCDGDYIARMDADDVMHRDRLAAQTAWLEDHPELAAVGTWVRIFPRGRLGAGWRAYERRINSIDSPDAVRREAFVEMPIVHPTLMIRREVLAAHRYRDLGWAEDYDLILRLLAAGHDIGVVPRRLLAWRDSPARATRADARCAMEQFTACKALVLANGILRGEPTYGLWGFGGTGRAIRRALREHGKTAAWIVDVHPGRLGNRIDGSPVLHPDHLPPPGRQPLLVSVARASARAEIRTFLQERGWRELHDFVCVA